MRRPAWSVSQDSQPAVAHAMETLTCNGEAGRGLSLLPDSPH